MHRNGTIKTAPYNHDESTNAHARSLQPNILINDRGYSQGDYSTPERHIPTGGQFYRLTEACQSVSSLSWGYRFDDDTYSNLYIMQSIDNILSRGGNYLLNVGPDASGQIPYAVRQKITCIGNWYRRVEESYKRAHFVTIPGIPYRITRREKYLYTHFDGIPVKSGVSLCPIKQIPVSAEVLNTMMPLQAKIEYLPEYFSSPDVSAEEYLHVNKIPVDELIGELIVLRLEFEDIEEVLALSSDNFREHLLKFL